MISYCTTVYNEKDYIKVLLTKLTKIVLPDEDIIVVQTYREEKEKDEEFFSEIQKIIKNFPNIIYKTFHFQASSTGWNDVKNYMNRLSQKPYIFNLDSDEDYPERSFDVIRDVAKNGNFDLVFVPRINTVEGLTREDVIKWGWNINSNNWINWPDYQPRLYKNNQNILWGGGPHDGVIGAKSIGAIEAREELAIIHKKDIIRQREQNNLYDKILQEHKNEY